MYLELHRGVFTSQLRTKQGNRRNEALLRRGRAVGQRPRRCAPASPTRTTSSSAAGTRCCCCSSTTSCPGRRSPGCTARPRSGTRRSSATLERIIDEALGALAGDVDSTVTPARVELAVNASPSRARRGARARGRCAVHPRRARWSPSRSTARPCSTTASSGRWSMPRPDHRRCVAHADGREAIPPGEPGERAAAPPRPAEPLGRVGPRRALPAHRAPCSTTVDALEVEHRAGRRCGRDDRAHASARRASSSGSSLRPGSASLELENRVDWRETEKILKLAVPLDVHADRIAAETQFGHLFRPTHANTSWDAARFEACQHRFVHVARARASGSRSRTTRPTATTSTARPRDGRRHDHHGAVLAAARAAVPRSRQRPGRARAAVPDPARCVDR